MLKHEDFIAVAVSGGKDSLSLLKILTKISIRHGSRLEAITIDEGIECYRSESLQYASNITRQLGVPHTIFSFKELFGMTLDEAVKNRRGSLSSCALCGTLRRRALDVGAMKLGVDVVATAHNLDDIIQTFMINLLNGDLKRISWLNPSSTANCNFRIRRVHPFLDVYEKEIALYAFTSNLPFQSVPCPYMDEGIRTDIRRYFNELEDQHPGVKYTMLKSAMSLSPRSSINQPKALQCSKCGFPSTSDPCSVCTLLSNVNHVTV